MPFPDENRKPGQVAVPSVSATVHLASRGVRLVANFIDWIVTYVIFLGPYIAYEYVYKDPLPDLLALASLIGAPLYYLLNDALPNGQSLGKRVFRIKVIDEKTGESCKVSKALLRNLTLVIPLINIFDVFFIFGDQRKRLGDHWAETLVVEVPIN